MVSFDQSRAVCGSQNGHLRPKTANLGPFKMFKNGQNRGKTLGRPIGSAGSTCSFLIKNGHSRAAQDVQQLSTKGKISKKALKLYQI